MATLAKAEGDIVIARGLLLVSSLRRTSETAYYSKHVAEQLGVGDEYGQLAETQREHQRTQSWAEQQHLHCIAALRDEMIRRNWLD